jgi:hypothetical protein
MEYFLVILFSIILLTFLLWTIRIADATRRRDIIIDDIAGCCESLGFVGCSAICSGVRGIARIEELLGQEYDRYEVIITIDAEQYPEEFRAIISHYRMIRVNCSRSEELPSATIRNLYRSRQRSFRRLILLDKPHSDIYGDLDAAAIVASYNYLLPVGPTTHLCNKAIESIAITLSEQDFHSIGLLHAVASDTYIFCRDAVINNGGFSPHIVRQIPHSVQLQTYTPIAIDTKNDTEAVALAIIAAIVLPLIFMFIGWGVVAAAASTIIAFLSIARYISRLTHPANCSLQVMLCYFRRIGSIFRRRKFQIS